LKSNHDLDLSITVTTLSLIEDGSKFQLGLLSKLNCR